MMKTTASNISVNLLELDLENPRLFHERLTGRGPETEEDLEKSISGDAEFKALLKSIRKSGVIDPIWVIAKSGGKFKVIEGNRRTTSLRTLLRQGVTPPEGVDYSHVRANIIDPSTPEKEIKLQKARLQTGKAVWGVFNVSALMYEFHHTDMMALEDIATEMQISITKVKKSLKSYEMFLEYSSSTGDVNKNRFAYFNEAPKKVLDWVAQSAQNKQDYFDWINPTDGRAKIRSAATKGGLRDFSKVTEDPDALTLLREDPRATVEDALEVVKQNDIQKDMPFLQRILPLQANINNLSPEQKARISSEPRVLIHLRSLRSACDSLLEELEGYNRE